MKENAFKCQWNGGKPPLGYDTDPVTKKLVIKEDEAIVVRKIFEMAAEGYGYNKIIQELNNLGYKTKAGNSFGKNSLYDLIQNERYYGVYIFNQRAKRSSNGTRNMRKHKDESEIIRIEGGNPAIVSKVLWDRANASRKISAKLSTNARYDYILTGLIHCGECGRKMCGNRRHGSTKSYLTYRCNRSSNQLNCACKEIHADVLESFVIDNLMKHFFDPKIIDIITEQVNRKIKDITSKENEFVTDARNALKGLNLAKNNLVEAIAHTGYNPTIGDKIESIEKQISEYQSIIDESEKEAADRIVDGSRYLKDAQKAAEAGISVVEYEYGATRFACEEARTEGAILIKVTAPANSEVELNVPKSAKLVVAYKGDAPEMPFEFTNFEYMVGGAYISQSTLGVKFMGNYKETMPSVKFYNAKNSTVLVVYFEEKK